MNKAEETLYQVLKVDPRSTISEIVAAYHSAKNAFAKDSIATYSLFSSEETKSILDRLEEAYLTLSNVDKKREYDRKLTLRRDGETAGTPLMTEFTDDSLQSLPLEQAGQVDSSTNRQVDSSNSQQPDRRAAEGERRAPAKPAAIAGPALVLGDGPLSGATLREAREKRALSVDDVARITKIPGKFIRAIEEDSLLQIPARVYLQGFVKNLATLYRLDPNIAVKAYLTHIDSLSTSAANS